MPKNKYEIYQTLVQQFLKEDDLYFKRLTLTTTITGAMVSAIFIAEITTVEVILISIFAISITYAINLQIDEGRNQLRNLRQFYHDNINLFSDYSCPFFSNGYDNDIRVPRLSRIIRATYVTWTMLILIAALRFFWS
jgi:hypothetical protein